MGVEVTESMDESEHGQSRVDHHLERALAHSDDPEVAYHLREALHLLRT